LIVRRDKQWEKLVNFSDNVSVKAVLISFIAYLVGSVVAVGVLVQVWMPSGTSAEEMARLAESAPALVIGSLFIGTLFCLAAGFLACHISGAAGLKNSLGLGFVFVAWAVLSIVMHPSDPLWLHALHLVAPVPVSLAGGAIRLSLRKSVASANAPSSPA
jgi:hypothetical protein